MAKSSTGPAAASLLLLFLAACSALASAASTCPYSNTSEPFPAAWNWLMIGPEPLPQIPDVDARMPGWLVDAMQASQLFTINTSLTFGSTELVPSIQLPEGPYAQVAAVYKYTVLPEGLYGQEVIDSLIPDDGTGLIYFLMQPGTYLFGIFGNADYQGLNVTQPISTVGDSVVNIAYTAFYCGENSASAITLSTSQAPANLDMLSFEDLSEVLPTLPAWMGDPDNLTLSSDYLRTGGASVTQYWPLIVRASGEPVPLFIRLQRFFSTEEDARLGVNSTNAVLAVTTYFVNAAEDFQDAGLDADSEQVHADLALVLNRLNDTLYGAPPAPASVPAPAPTSSAVPAAAAGPMMVMMAMVLALLTPSWWA